MDRKRSFALLAIMIALAAVTATSMTISYSNSAFAQTLPLQAAPQATEHSILGGNCPPDVSQPICK